MRRLLAALRTRPSLDSASDLWARWRLSILLATGLLLGTLVPTGGLFDGGADAGIGVAVWGHSVGLDAWLHAVGFGALAASLVLTADRRSWQVVLGAVVVATAFGAGIELLQSPLPWRTGSPADALANAVGATVGASLAAAAWPVVDRRSPGRSDR